MSTNDLIKEIEEIFKNHKKKIETQKDFRTTNDYYGNKACKSYSAISSYRH